MEAASQNIKPNKDAMLMQLHHLFGDYCEDALIELVWTDPARGHALSHARMFKIEDFGEIPEFAANININGSNVYFGAALRHPGLPLYKRANDSGFHAITAAYVDLDKPGSFDQASEIYGHVKPSLIVTTGRHPHVRAQLWWRFEDIERCPNRMRKLHKGLAESLQGDGSVINPSRVMRLGGSIAWPVKAGRIAEVTEVKLGHGHHITYEALEGIATPQLPYPSVLSRPASIKAKSDFNFDDVVRNIRAGKEWHNNMLKLTAHWVNKGLSDQDILLASEGLTLPGYSSQQTRDEMLVMIEGARNKWRHSVAPNMPSAALSIRDWTSNKYLGSAPEQKWLVEGAIPLGVPILLAAMGGIGKSYLALDLALKVSIGKSEYPGSAVIFGGVLKAHGTAVVIAAEDSYETIHRRFNRFDPLNLRLKAAERLIVIPMPSVGGPRALIDAKGGSPHKTPFFNDLKQQLMAIPDLVLVVIDPLQAFVMADVTSDPAAAQYMWSALAEICAETKATVIVTHHMRKEGMNNIRTIHAAREAIRGSTALVDGARGVYALWQAESDYARLCCQLMGRDYEDNAIIHGAIVKSNDDVRQEIHTYARAQSGLLIQNLSLDNLKADDFGYPDEDKEIEILKEIERRWSAGEPLSQAPNTGPRYIIKFLKSHFGLSKSVAQALQGKWISEGLIATQMVNSSTKLKGYRLIKLPIRSAEGAEA